MDDFFLIVRLSGKLCECAEHAVLKNRINYFETRTGFSGNILIISVLKGE
ncbi:hypothetical protein Metlim_0572 [Methanoplanus limicola DSM 2279]|uniref:Uncharacterized protein n=1 Tax=Methanoplanus limicola DSM 2279 TaxID=937775 RepID=H1Z2W6_9EURY|nr:hypothetical protein Metlim_0572 [Methanoplanus limicola DSM 2279]